MAKTYENSAELSYPLTNMNFLVTVANISGTAAFSEVNGIDASVDVIKFRQGNSHSLSVVKMPGLVNHSAITLKFGYTLDSAFKTWVQECVSETRGEPPRSDIQIELIDINGGAPKSKVMGGDKKNRMWVLKDAFVMRYTAPMMNAMSSSVAYESVTLEYEELIIPN